MTSNRILRANPGTSLTLDEMRASLPSIFADHPHESRSEKYVYISTEDMLGRLMDSGFLPVEARMSRTRDKTRTAFTKHMLRFRSASELGMPDNSSLTKSLGVAFEVIMRNAHDGTGSYQLLAGLIRFACENGLVVSDGTVAQLKVYHMGERRRLMDTVLSSAHTVLEQGPKVADKLRAWKGITLHRDQAVAFAREAHKLRFADAKGEIRTPILPEQLLVPRRPSDVGSSLWETFNVVQENALRGGLSAYGKDRNGRRYKAVTLGIHGIDGDVGLNRKLWELADKTALEVA
jgi:Domain of unknown function (DUF932)